MKMKAVVMSLLSFTLSSFLYAEELDMSRASFGSEANLVEQETLTTNSGANQFAVVCIINNTGMTMSYSYQWGTAGWRTMTTNAGGSHWFAWRYKAGDQTSPNFQVTFDYDLRSGRHSQKTYSLARYAAPFEDCGKAKQYKFTRTGDFVDLYSVN